MSDSAAYRGPDDHVVSAFGPLGIAFRRLSIMDLAGGRQPFVSRDGGLVVAVNGEILNHRELRSSLELRHTFRTRSDCEVVLHQFQELGTAAFETFRGMFGAVVWDLPKRELILARDRFGIKPMFYTFTQTYMLFASELKSLLQVPDCSRSIDWEVALSDPAFGGFPALSSEEPHAWFKDIRVVPASGVVSYRCRTGENTLRHYWQLQLRSDANAEATAIVNDYRDALEEAVREALVADVEVGLLLSGGIDSAVVAALASRTHCLHTFSVLSQSTLASGDSSAGRAVAQLLGLPNHQVVFTPDDLTCSPAVWADLVWLCETPICGAVQLYRHLLYRHARAARSELKVLLTGDGGDEFDGGYSALFADSWEGFLNSQSAFNRGGLMRRAPAWLFVWNDHFPGPLLSREYLQSLTASALPGNVWEEYVHSKYRDLQMVNLWQDDRTAAGAGIETRVPFLDHRVVEIALSIPDHLAPELLWDKRLLRLAAGDMLPADVCRRPKVPFFYGEGERHTQRAILRTLEIDGGQLIDLALSGGDSAYILDRNGINLALQSLREDPDLRGFDFLLRLINLGLLEQMARSASSRALDALSARVPPTSLSSAQLEGGIASLSRRLAGLYATINDETVLTLQPHIEIVQRLDRQHNGWLVLVDDKALYEIPATKSTWVRFLRSIDGSRTIRQVLDDAGADDDSVMPEIEEALRFGLISADAEHLRQTSINEAS